MKKEEIQVLFKSFEDAACMVDQVECWSARELQKLLGYSKWENFAKVIKKAKDACETLDKRSQTIFLTSGKRSNWVLEQSETSMTSSSLVMPATLSLRMVTPRSRR